VWCGEEETSANFGIGFHYRQGMIIDECGKRIEENGRKRLM
jgi:hypothetical protein